MALPESDAEGLLPPGVHEATVDEVRARFGGFQGSDRRPRLQRGLEEYLALLRGAELSATVIVNGSFVTGRPDPGDVDLIVELPADHDVGRDFRPDQENVMSAQWVRRHYEMDVLVAITGTPAHKSYLDLFSEVKGRPGLRKGIVRVAP